MKWNAKRRCRKYPNRKIAEKRCRKMQEQEEKKEEEKKTLKEKKSKGK